VYIIHCDSSCEPFHPRGILTWAFLVKHKKQIIHQDTEIIGWGGKHHTNNLGEMTAVLAAMQWLIRLPENKRLPAVINSDSELIVNQCLGIYNCYDDHLLTLLEMILKAKDVYGRSVVLFKWVPREKNKEADKLSRSLYTEEMLGIMRANKNNIIFDWDDIPF